jgi:hypothetical protein
MTTTAPLIISCLALAGGIAVCIQVGPIVWRLMRFEGGNRERDTFLLAGTFLMAGEVLISASRVARHLYLGEAWWVLTLADASMVASAALFMVLNWRLRRRGD